VRESGSRNDSAGEGNISEARRSGGRGRREEVHDGLRGRRTFEEETTPEEVVAQAVAIAGLSREEAEQLLIPFIEEMVEKGLLG